MKRIMIAATVALLATAGCTTIADTEPVAATSAAAQSPGATLTSGSTKAETSFDEQMQTWLTQCHNALDAESGTTHDISWDHSVSLSGNEYRLIGTATPAQGNVSYMAVCDVDNNWNVTLDPIRTALPREGGARMSVSYASDFAPNKVLNAGDVKVDKCLDVLAGEYGAEQVSVVIDFSSINETSQGRGHIISGTATGTTSNTSTMNFACSIPNWGEPKLMHFY